MYYTIDKIVLLKNDKSIPTNPQKYKSGELIGDELIAFLTAHLGEMSWKLGATTQMGPHSFMLTMFPMKRNLLFWRQVEKMNGQVRIDCDGNLEAVVQGDPLTPPPGFDPDRVPAQKKVINQKTLEQFIKRRMNRLFGKDT